MPFSKSLMQDIAFKEPVFVAQVSRLAGVTVEDQDGFMYPVMTDGSDGFEAFYVIDGEVLDLLKKRQPRFLYGALPGELNGGES